MQKQSLWYPYAQMKIKEENLLVDSAQGVNLQLADGRQLIDAIASWWCVIYGYRHPELDQVLKQQIDSISHVMLGGLVNEPAKQLADKLVEVTPNGLNHVFYGDSGSVGIEVALKMAVQFWNNQGYSNKSRIVSLKKAYHGDTTGCMSVGDPEEGMHHLFSGYLPQQIFLEAPTGGYFANLDIVQNYMQKFERLLQQQADDIAALIVEPLMQAAGGFNFYSPDYLKQFKALCDQYNVLLIFDEVATGFGRTGTLFAAEQADVCPDIMVLSKGLTGGYLGHSATLATTRVFEAFYADDISKAFMHGPTFMGNPLACSVALKCLEIFQRDNFLQRIERIEMVLKQHLLGFTANGVVDSRVLGATGVIEVTEPSVLSGVQEFAAEQGVWLRPFDNYLYTMPPYIITEKELVNVVKVMKDWFHR